MAEVQQRQVGAASRDGRWNAFLEGVFAQVQAPEPAESRRQRQVKWGP